MARSGANQTQGVKPKHRNVPAAARVIAALDLAIEGHDWQTIANQAGYASRGAAYDAVQRELKRRLDTRVDSLRDLHLARLGRLRSVYFPKAMAGDGWSMDRVLRLDERESALMGLDAVRENTPQMPTIIEISAVTTQAVRGLPAATTSETSDAQMAAPVAQADGEGEQRGDSDSE